MRADLADREIVIRAQQAVAVRGRLNLNGISRALVAFYPDLIPLIPRLSFRGTVSR